MTRGYYVVKLQQAGGPDSFTFENVPLLEDGNYDQEHDTGINFRCELAEWPNVDPSIVHGELEVTDKKFNRIVWDERLYDTLTEHWVTDFLTARVRERGQCRIFYGDTSTKARSFEIKSVLRC